MAIHHETGARDFVLGNPAKKADTRTESWLPATVGRTLFKSIGTVKTLLRFLRVLLPMRQHESPFCERQPTALQTAILGSTLGRDLPRRASPNPGSVRQGQAPNPQVPACGGGRTSCQWTAKQSSVASTKMSGINASSRQ